MNLIFDYYYSKVLDLVQLEPSVKFLNTKNYIKNQKKTDIYKKPLALFCDSMHQTFMGKVTTAKIISDLINGKK